MGVRTRQFLIFCGGITVLALIFRLTRLYDALEYDELWSLQNYVPLSIRQILTDLALPNNHPLNTLGMKLFAGWDSRVMLRLHSLLAGIGTVIAGGGFALSYYRSRRAAWWTMLCLALSIPLIAYSQLARGYSLQVFFITLFAWSCAAIYSRFRLPGIWKYLPEWGIVLAGAGAVWSVSSSALFLFPISLAAVWPLLLRWRQGERAWGSLAAFGVFGLFVLCWYGSLWQVMRGAQSWATPVTGVQMYLAWVWKTFRELGFPLGGLILLALYRKNRLIAFTVLVPVLLSIFTNLAGPRVFLPLIPAFAAMTGYGASRFRRRGWILAAGFAVCSLMVRPAWIAVDWYKLFDEAKVLPPECVTLYSATAGYPLSENNGKAAMIDFVRRLQHGGDERIFVLVGSPVLNGVDRVGREQEIAPVKGEKIRLGDVDAWAVRMKKVKRLPEKGDLLVAVVPPVRPELAVSLMQKLGEVGPGWQLNRWLTRDITQLNKAFCYRLAVFRVEDPAAFDPAILQLPAPVLTLYFAGGTP